MGWSDHRPIEPAASQLNYLAPLPPLLLNRRPSITLTVYSPLIQTPSINAPRRLPVKEVQMVAGRENVVRKEGQKLPSAPKGWDWES